MNDTGRLWRCWNIDCLAQNQLGGDACYNCGYDRGYRSPEIQALIYEVRLEELRRLLPSHMGDVNPSEIHERIAEIKQERSTNG